MMSVQLIPYRKWNNWLLSQYFLGSAKAKETIVRAGRALTVEHKLKTNAVYVSSGFFKLVLGGYQLRENDLILLQISKVGQNLVSHFFEESYQNEVPSIMGHAFQLSYEDILKVLSSVFFGNGKSREECNKIFCARE